MNRIIPSPANNVDSLFTEQRPRPGGSYIPNTGFESRSTEKSHGLTAHMLFAMTKTGEDTQSTQPISSSMTPTKPRLYGSSPLFGGGHWRLRCRSFSASGIEAARSLNSWISSNMVQPGITLTSNFHGQHTLASPTPRRAQLDDCAAGQC
jgi:hypothetical protein